MAKSTSSFNSDHTIRQYKHGLLLESPLVPSTTDCWVVWAKIRQRPSRCETGSRNMAATHKLKNVDDFLPSFFPSLFAQRTIVQHATSQSIMSRTTRLSKALTAALYTVSTEYNTMTIDTSDKQNTKNDNIVSGPIKQRRDDDAIQGQSGRRVGRSAAGCTASGLGNCQLHRAATPRRRCRRRRPPDRIGSCPTNVRPARSPFAICGHAFLLRDGLLQLGPRVGGVR